MADPLLPPLTELPPELPVVPLRGAVLFPMTVQPLGVDRPVSVDAINRALAADRLCCCSCSRTTRRPDRQIS